MKIIAATQNKHKLEEIYSIIKNFDMELITLKDAGFGAVDVEENGKTCEENSFIKADAICKLTGESAIADDSGLFVDALGGEPGVNTARYAGVIRQITPIIAKRIPNTIPRMLNFFKLEIPQIMAIPSTIKRIASITLTNAAPNKEKQPRRIPRMIMTIPFPITLPLVGEVTSSAIVIILVNGYL